MANERGNAQTAREAMDGELRSYVHTCVPAFMLARPSGRRSIGYITYEFDISLGKRRFRSTIGAPRTSDLSEGTAVINVRKSFVLGEW